MLNKRNAFILFSLLALFTLLPAPHTVQAQGSFVMSPVDTTVDVDTEFTVGILATAGGTAIDGAEVHLTFDPALLEVLSLNPQGPANGLSIELVPAAFDNTNGTIDYGAFETTAPFPSTDFTLLSITFRALAPAPATMLDFTLAPAFPPTEMTGGGVSVLSGVSSGTITVKEELLVSPIIFLQGAYDMNTGLMRDDLRANALLPLTEPYTTLGYIHVGDGGESTQPAVLDVTGADAIVDWVVLELRDKADSTILLATRSALLQRDGDVVDVDGVSPVTFPNLPVDDYFLVLRHRNHLGVMSATPAALSNMAAVVDFTTILGSTFGGSNGIAALGDGNLGLYSGDFNRNGQVQNTDYSFMVLTLGTSGYVDGDFDLNGQVQNTDVQLKLLLNIGKGQAFRQVQASDGADNLRFGFDVAMDEDGNYIVGKDLTSLPAAARLKTCQA